MERAQLQGWPGPALSTRQWMRLPEKISGHCQVPACSWVLAGGGLDNIPLSRPTAGCGNTGVERPAARIGWTGPSTRPEQADGRRNSLSNSPCPLGRARGRGLI